MLLTDRSLVRTQQPAFDQSGNPVDARHANMGRIAGIRENNYVVFVAAFGKLTVATPTISQNLRPILGNITNERNKALSRDIRYPTHSHSPESARRMDLHCNGHNLYLFAAASPLPTNICTSDVSFVYFNATTKLIPTGTHHSFPKFVQQRPSSLIASKSKKTLQSQSTRPIFLAGYKPHGSKPSFQRHSCPVKDGPRRDRNLTSALPTMKVTTTCRPRFRLQPAPSTFKALRPTAPINITAACRFIGEPLQKLLVRSRVVLSLNRIGLKLHRRAYYILGSLASSGYPFLKFLQSDRMDLRNDRAFGNEQRVRKLVAKPLYL